MDSRPPGRRRHVRAESNYFLLQPTSSQLSHSISRKHRAALLHPLLCRENKHSQSDACWLCEASSSSEEIHHHPISRSDSSSLNKYMNEELSHSHMGVNEGSCDWSVFKSDRFLQLINVWTNSVSGVALLFPASFTCTHIYTSVFNRHHNYTISWGTRWGAL